MSEKEHLFIIFKNLMRIKGECSCEIFSECGLSDITVRQIEYLKAIDRNEDITFGKLAEITSNSKPTITDMVNRFVSMECVYRDRCPQDRRISYIRLTEKGRNIARADEISLMRTVDRMAESLSSEEIRTIAGILEKIG